MRKNGTTTKHHPQNEPKRASGNTEKRGQKNRNKSTSNLRNNTRKNRKRSSQSNRRNRQNNQKLDKSMEREGRRRTQKKKGGGRPPKIRPEEWEKIAEEAIKRKMTLKQAHAYVIKKLQKEVSLSTIHRWLRKRLKLPYGKPYPVPKKRPPNAEEILAERLAKALEQTNGDIELVFVDETAICEMPPIIRVFGAGKIRVPVSRRKRVFIGGVSLRGEGVIHVVEKGDSESFAEFLELVAEHFKGKKVVLVLDNARFHKSRVVLSKARELGICLCFLPPYSPDLNPIEFLWKDLKRALAFESFSEAVKKAVCVFLQLVKRIASYACSWLKKFGRILASRLGSLVGGIECGKKF